MNTYTEADLLRLAKRHHNTKRTYLLVDPLQGKHIPVSPEKSLAMLTALGEKLHGAYGDVDLVIGFAETATAVGAVVASCQGEDCAYIHTTREPFSIAKGEVIEFQEEHSHATEQCLRAERLGEMIRRAHTIAFVDDEISTGKTLLNIIQVMRERFADMQGKRVLAVSIINRLTEERIAVLAEQGVECLSLLQLPMLDYTEAVRDFSIRGAEPPEGEPLPYVETVLSGMTEDPRVGVAIGAYMAECDHMAQELLHRFGARLAGRTVLVLGTEECMLPAMRFGRLLEASGAKSVRNHATTRSPIGLCDAEGYPITSGAKLHSFYEQGRNTFIYDLTAYDVCVIISDTPDAEAAQAAFADLSAALKAAGCSDIILVREAEHVRNL